jgi:hypothetical protein
VNDAGEVAFMAMIQQAGQKAKAAVLEGTSPAVVARVGDAADGGGAFKSFTDPMLDQAGRVAFVGAVTGAGITTANDGGIWSNAFGGGVRLVARENDLAASGSGARLQTFKSVALESGTGAPSVVYEAVLSNAAGTNKVGLWSFDGTTTRLLLRTGMSMSVSGSAKTLTNFAALQWTATGMTLPLNWKSGGQGFGLCNGVLTALLKFSDGLTALATIHADGTDPEIVALKGDAAAGYGAGTIMSGFTNFGQNSAGGAVFDAAIYGATASGSATAIYAVSGGLGGTLRRMVAAGDDAVSPAGNSFAWFSAIASNNEDSVAFTASVAGPGGAVTYNQGVWMSDGTSVTPVAFESGPAAECGGATWGKISSLALPDNGNAVFLATLNIGTGTPAVTRATDTALWGVDSTGHCRVLVREGVTRIGTRTVRNFKVLPVVSTSPSQTRSHNGAGTIVYSTTFTDGKHAIVKVQMP